jgi:AraC family ethanolamine operon transcriptional activator
MGKAWQGDKPVSFCSTVVDSIDALRTPIGNSDIEVVQLGQGRLSGRITRVSLGDVSFSRGAFSLPIRATGIFSRTAVTIAVLLKCSGEAKNWLGVFHPGDMSITPPGFDHYSTYTGAAAFACLSLEPSALRRIFVGEDRMSDPAFWSRRHIYRARNGCRRAELEEILRLGFEKLSDRTTVPESTTDYWERTLVDAFLGNMGAPLLEGDAALVAASGARIVREVEHYVDARQHRPIHISELCSHLNVSRRTLHRCFEDAVGIGPSAFLRHKRLCSVHSALRRLDPKNTLVTQVAIDFGFLELGRFSAQYRSLFGEYPHETLRR